MSVRRLLAPASVLLLLPALPALPAGAHAVLEHASPPVGGTVRVAPRQVRLVFSEPLDPASSAVRVLDESGARVDRDPVRVEPRDARVVRVPLAPLRPGAYRVRWRAVSADGHTTEGEFTFRVAP